jgi:hypothetical protein
MDKIHRAHFLYDENSYTHAQPSGNGERDQLGENDLGSKIILWYILQCN